MKQWLLILLLLLPLSVISQNDDPLSHYGTQLAAQGTDFWVCFPRTMRGGSPNHSRLYVVCEHDCDVTVSNELIDYSQTVHIMHRSMCGPDTNYIEIPFVYTRIIDTVPYLFPSNDSDSPERPHIPRYNYSGCPGDLPQAKGFHVTSTDTISLFILVSSTHMSACTVLPTELLRDEYIAQPPIVSHHHFGGEGDPIHLPLFMPGMSSIDIVAADDSTVVDIVLTDWDWMNRLPGDTVTVTLGRGELYHLSAGEIPEKYYPLLSPYYDPDHLRYDDPMVIPTRFRRHAFNNDFVERDTFAIDLAGTHIKARDCKRIAVFESSCCGGGGLRGLLSYNMKLEQSTPIYFAGKKYLIPNVHTRVVEADCVRITALNESTTVTIRDGLDPTMTQRTLTIAPGKTNYWEFDTSSGPLYITANKPVLLKRIGKSMSTITPTRWWHWGQVNFGTMTYVDESDNRVAIKPRVDIFTLTSAVPYLFMDFHRLEDYFQPIVGTPYSYASFDWPNSFTSEGTHHIVSRNGSPFMAYLTDVYTLVLPHVQPGRLSFTVNGMPADSLKTDSIWCMYDPVTFKASNQRPCDSLFWDFGDGTSLAFSHNDPAFSQPQTHLFQDTGHFTVQAIFKYEDEGCFTRKSDTLSTTLIIHSHHDSIIPVSLCEGSYFFRDNELDSSGIYYFTTYWTQSGCDTLWTIDLVTCPHCHWVYDTVAPDDLPVTFNGISFGSECHDEPVHIRINDNCDSIIYYTLIVIPNWGEKPIDSTWIIAPNVITPALESNNLFSLHCSPHIIKAEVTIFDRRGTRLTQFDGLTGHWDGTANGNPCHQGTYVYYIRYIDTHDEGWKALTGTVTLLR